MNNRLNIYYIFCLVLLLVNTSCTQEVPTNTKPIVATETPNPLQTNPNPLPTQPKQNKPTINTQLVQQNGIVAKKRPVANFVKCTSINKTLSENIVALKNQNITAFISANDSTMDTDMGESHRVFEVKSGANCEVVFSQTFPVNVSPDFPYYLSTDAVNNELGLIGIRGFHSANVYEIATKKCYTDLKPKFTTERAAADASSGMISHLFFDQHYLYGYAVDFGIFVFDMNKNGNPLLPILEFSQTQLFGFERAGNQVDVFIPIVNFDENGMFNLEMRNVFQKSVGVNLATAVKHKGGKYVLLSENIGGEATQFLVVDMAKKTSLKLPDEIAKSSIEKVKAFLK